MATYYITAKRDGDNFYPVTAKVEPKVQLVCNECGKKRLVSAEGNYNDRCPKCGGVDWDVL